MSSAASRGMSPGVRRVAGWAAFLLFAALAGYVVLSTLSAGRVRCEVEMVMEGRTATVTARGATEAEALRAARTGACARIAFGRTENIRCLDTPPLRAGCE